MKTVTANDIEALLAEYRCKHCGQTVMRSSDKAWIPSWCERTGKTTHLVRLDRLKGHKAKR